MKKEQKRRYLLLLLLSHCIKVCVLFLPKNKHFHAFAIKHQCIWHRNIPNVLNSKTYVELMKRNIHHAQLNAKPNIRDLFAASARDRETSCLSYRRSCKHDLQEHAKCKSRKRMNQLKRLVCGNSNIKTKSNTQSNLYRVMD